MTTADDSVRAPERRPDDVAGSAEEQRSTTAPRDDCNTRPKRDDTKSRLSRLRRTGGRPWRARDPTRCHQRPASRRRSTELALIWTSSGLLWPRYGHSDSADHFDPIHAETKSPTRPTGAESPSRSPCLDMRSLRRQERLDNTTAGATGAADNHICRRRATTSNDAAHAFAYRDRATSETHPDDTKRGLMRNRQTQATPLVTASIMLLKTESIRRAAILAFGPKTH
jgi:hypothetical protein